MNRIGGQIAFSAQNYYSSSQPAANQFSQLKTKSKFLQDSLYSSSGNSLFKLPNYSFSQSRYSTNQRTFQLVTDKTLKQIFNQNNKPSKQVFATAAEDVVQAQNEALDEALDPQFEALKAMFIGHGHDEAKAESMARKLTEPEPVVTGSPRDDGFLNPVAHDDELLSSPAAEVVAVEDRSNPELDATNTRNEFHQLRKSGLENAEARIDRYDEAITDYNVEQIQKMKDRGRDGQVERFESKDQFDRKALEFWKNQEKFWKSESTVLSDRLGEMETLNPLYKELRQLEDKVDRAARSRDTNAFNEHKEQALAKRIEIREARYGDDYAEFDINPHMRTIETQEHIDSYDEDIKAIKDEVKKWNKVKNINAEEKQAEIDSLNQTKKIFTEMKKYWKRQNKFWDDLSQAPASKTGMETINNAMTQLKELEGNMEDIIRRTLSLDKNTSKTAKQEKRAVDKQINDLKRRIKKAHTDF